MNNMGQMISVSELVNIKQTIKEPTISSKNLNMLNPIVSEPLVKAIQV